MSTFRKMFRAIPGAIPWKFLIFQDVLPFADLITDFISGLKYQKDGHRYWALCTWTLMGVPLVLTISSEMLNLFRSCKNTKSHKPNRVGTTLELETIRHDVENQSRDESLQTWFQKNEMKIWKFLAQIPFLQPVVHAIFTHKLYRAESGMEKALADYKKLDLKDLGEELKKKVETSATDYVHWKKEKSSILTTFQGIRLFELIGESGPQAVLQLSIALRIGYIDWIQVR